MTSRSKASLIITRKMISSSGAYVYGKPIEQTIRYRVALIMRTLVSIIYIRDARSVTSVRGRYRVR